MIGICSIPNKALALLPPRLLHAHLKVEKRRTLDEEHRERPQRGIAHAKRWFLPPLRPSGRARRASRIVATSVAAVNGTTVGLAAAGSGLRTF
jgi:hypothetical protein